jgi:hypothetical protein
MKPGFHVYVAGFCWFIGVEEANCDDNYRLLAIASLVIMATVVACIGMACLWCCLNYLKDLIMGIIRFLTCNFFQPCSYMANSECGCSKKRGCSDCCCCSSLTCPSLSCFSGGKVRSSGRSSRSGCLSCFSMSLLKCSSRKYFCCTGCSKRGMRDYVMVEMAV